MRLQKCAFPINFACNVVKTIKIVQFLKYCFSTFYAIPAVANCIVFWKSLCSPYVRLSLFWVYAKFRCVRLENIFLLSIWQALSQSQHVYTQRCTCMLHSLKSSLPYQLKWISNRKPVPSISLFWKPHCIAYTTASKYLSVFSVENWKMYHGPTQT